MKHESYQITEPPPLPPPAHGNKKKNKTKNCDFVLLKSYTNSATFAASSNLSTFLKIECQPSRSSIKKIT